MRDFILPMTYMYLILVGLAMVFPEIGHEAGPTFEPDVYIEENALISGGALASQGNEAPINKKAVPAIMKKIAECESHNQHFDESGKVLRGNYDPRDIGRYQINRAYWEDKAVELGYDIYDEAGNEAFALYLYHAYGTDPWKQSRWCWSQL